MLRKHVLKSGASNADAQCNQVLIANEATVFVTSEDADNPKQ